MKNNNPDFIDGVEDFLCDEFCPLFDECPFNGEWQECKIHDMINGYEELIENLNFQAEQDEERCRDYFGDISFDRAMNAYQESKEEY